MIRMAQNRCTITLRDLLLLVARVLMNFIKNSGSPRKKTARLMVLAIASLIFYACLQFQSRFVVTIRIDARDAITPRKTTHLWSFPLADDTYFRLARLIPCQTVEYIHETKPGGFHSCTTANADDFSIENSIHAQQWLYDHQHPSDCSNKRFAIIRKHAWSGFGSTVHQTVWAFGIALAQNRIALYESPGNWLFGDCPSVNMDCFFLPISNCSLSDARRDNQTIYIDADVGNWKEPVHPPLFRSRSFNWYRAQLTFYLLRYNAETLAHVRNVTFEHWNKTSIAARRPFIALYVRRSDKVTGKEMSQAYPLKQYFDLFDADARRLNISNVYINSEDEQVFSEFAAINEEKQGYYKLFTIKARKNVLFFSLVGMEMRARKRIVLEFLTDLYVEAHADLHGGTLTSNWCRLVDEFRLTLGKTLVFYTPENRFLLDR